MNLHQSSPRGPTYISTTIPYVNAAPHVGFALELAQTDALARYLTLSSTQVRTSTGTDDHSLKNLRAAQALGLPVAELVQRNAQAFGELRSILGTHFGDSVSTSQDARHRASVEWLFRACQANGDVYRRKYRGEYCVGCEQFYQPDELVSGACPQHETRLEVVEEENWFFRLSRYQEPLYGAIESDELRILPAERKNEALSFIASGLEDFSVSRSAERAYGFGIRVPGDESQVIYVWLDALANYLTAGSIEGSEPIRAWQDASRRIHVLGKGVLRFHAVYWPALLLSAGLALPTELRVHGYLTVEGKKIGKSAGNGIAPSELLRDYGQTALRYYLLRHVPSLKDADFSRERLIQAHDAELADELGNLALRVLSLTTRHCDGRIPAPGVVGDEEQKLDRVATELRGHLEASFQRHDLSEALARVFELVRASNRYLDRTEPWRIAKSTAKTPAAHTQLCTVLATAIASLRVLARALSPFIPELAERLAQAVCAPIGPGALTQTSLFEDLPVGSVLGAAEALVPRLRPRPARGRARRSD